MKDDKMDKDTGMPGAKTGTGTSGSPMGPTTPSSGSMREQAQSGSGPASVAADGRQTAQPQQHKFRDALHPHGILGVPDNPLGTEGSQGSQGGPFPSGGATGAREYLSDSSFSPAPVEIQDGLPTAGPIHGGEKPKPKDK